MINDEKVNDGSIALNEDEAIVRYMPYIGYELI